MSKVRVLLFGHSLIHWLHNFENRNMNNFNLKPEDFHLDFLGIRGATLHWNENSKSRFQSKSLVAYLTEFLNSALTPDIVYLQIGGNDLDSQENPHKLVQHIWSLAEFLVHGCAIKYVLIGHIFKRQAAKIGKEEYERRRLLVNHELSQKKDKNIKVCPNHGFTAEINKKFNKDGVHLTDFGNLCFAKNVRRELIYFGSRKLPCSNLFTSLL